MNQLTEEAAIVDNTTAGRNLAAFQAMTGLSEGTEGRGGYRACFGYKHTIQDMRDHPAITGEWRGEVLSDTMCANAGFGPGCVSTAAGRYQITKPTWRDFGGAARHGAFDEAGQDSCFADIVNYHGAMQDILAGRVMAAVGKLRTRWASFPGNKAKQGQRTPEKLVAWFQQQGGVLA
jgi:muramidase (phage lysozyme)